MPGGLFITSRSASSWSMGMDNSGCAESSSDFLGMRNTTPSPAFSRYEGLRMNTPLTAACPLETRNCKKALLSPCRRFPRYISSRLPASSNDTISLRRLSMRKVLRLAFCQRSTHALHDIVDFQICKHDDRNGFCGIACLKLLEHIEPVHFR